MFGQDMTRIEEMIAKAQGQASKATISTSTGIVMYDLEPLLKQVYPVLAPFRNEALPRRVSSIGGTAINAKRLLSITPATGGIGVAEGLRGGRIGVVEQDFSAIYRTIGQEADLTFEAEDAAQGFDDARAVRTTSLLNSNLMEEERAVLFGNGGNITIAGSSAQTALGTPATPVLAGANTGGTITAATYLCWVVALTYQGLRNASVAGGVPLTTARTNMDGSTTTTNGGSSNTSAQSNAIVISGTGVLSATVAATPGAFGYAWYVGTSKSAAALAAVTPVNKMSITAPPAGTQTANLVTADNSLDGYVFDGLITQVQQTSSGSYVASLDGANLTSNGAAGIVEWDLALTAMYNNYKLDPEEAYIDAGTMQAANKKVLANGGAPLYRFNVDGGSGAVSVVGGGNVGSYVNPITKRLIKLKVHPWFPQGTTFFNSRTLPYQTPNVPVPYRLQPRVADWREYEWVPTTRSRAHGQYLTAAMVVYAPFAFGLIQNQGQA